jgi:hypothetical protein
MIDRQQALPAPAHPALRGEQLFRRGFVSDRGLARHVAQRVDRLRRVGAPADQAAALLGTRAARVRVQLFHLRAPECDDGGTPVDQDADTLSRPAAGLRPPVSY